MSNNLKFKFYSQQPQNLTDLVNKIKYSKSKGSNQSQFHECDEDLVHRIRVEFKIKNLIIISGSNNYFESVCNENFKNSFKKSNLNRKLNAVIILIKFFKEIFMHFNKKSRM